MLPKINVPKYTETLPHSEKEVSIRPYVVGEQKIIMAIINSGKDEMSQFKEIIDRFVDGIEFEDISLVDMFYIIAKIRAMSKGETIEGEYECDECEKNFDFEFDIIENMIIDNEDVKTKIVDLDEKLTLVIEPIKFNVLQHEDFNVKLASMINKVKYENKVYTDFTQEELIENIIDQLSSTYIKKLNDAYDEMISIKLKINATCPFCKHVNEKEVEDIFDFFT